MSPYSFSPDKERELNERLRLWKVQQKDLQETFIRSSGPGGQNVNKVATCVLLYHRPTGITVKCQSERSQALNRYRARCLLLEKLEQREARRMAQKIEKREKLRRQNRQRSQAAKEKILIQKKKRSEKKASRRKLLHSEWTGYY